MFKIDDKIKILISTSLPSKFIGMTGRIVMEDAETKTYGCIIDNHPMIIWLQEMEIECMK